MNWDRKLEEFEDLIRMGIRATRDLGVEHPFSKQQMLLLMTLKRMGRMTVSELAEELHLSASATTIAINRLVRDGHIVRTRDETDRRLVWVVLSEPVKNLINEFCNKRNAVLIKMFNTVTPEEVDQFMAIVRKMVDGLSKPD
ncbi:MarR family winged helix-turn-helix transcriptional regulator [Paenibacillus hamazuiensis]|uniref:MarR family winged helix-turn-helix transcriptional regulator n=1 Tax=Paenibacillus hamazuiensis TaxID=2936508 RepID=UPI0020100F10|nr:MarR family transcriptional regulator [Paenibacillus hamazuiensis]